jgi:hypothetical protein
MYYQSQRDEVCDKYEKFFVIMQLPANGVPKSREDLLMELVYEFHMDQTEAEKWINETGGFLDISEIKDARRLFCHCAPRRCHCDFLARMIDAIKEPGTTEEGLWKFEFGDE